MAEQIALVARFQEGQKTLLDAVSGLDESQASEVWSGTWSVKDILAHIIGWELALSEALDMLGRGERPSVEGVDLNDTDGNNAIFAERASDKTFVQLTSELRNAGERVVVAIEAVPDERIQEGRTARRIVETLIHHPAEHTGEILDWRKSHGC
jgi:uncharacterized damage-inducible protein DinB